MVGWRGARGGGRKEERSETRKEEARRAVLYGVQETP